MSKVMYPKINDQEDIRTVVMAEYESKTGKILPVHVIDKILANRKTSIRDGMAKGKTIKLDRLGKLLITPSAKDKQDIIDYLGDDNSPVNFKKELDRRKKLGILNVQKYSKITGKVQSSYNARFGHFKVSNRHPLKGEDKDGNTI